MSKQPILVVAIASVVLFLALWVSSAEGVWFIHGSDAASNAEDDTDLQDRPTDERDAPEVRDDAVQEDNVGIWLDIVATILLCAVAVLLAVTFVQRTRRRIRERNQRRMADGDATRAPPTGLAEPVEVPPELIEATDDLAVTLQQGTPRNAIVTCWVALEEASARAGLARHPAETSVEFTTRVLATFAVDESAIVRLAELYREARFSRHELTEQHRLDAVECLQELRLRLRAGAQHGAGAGS